MKKIKIGVDDHLSFEKKILMLSITLSSQEYVVVNPNPVDPSVFFFLAFTTESHLYAYFAIIYAFLDILY